MKQKQILILVLLVIVGLGCFFCGTKYQQRKMNSQFSQRVGLNSEGGQGIGRNNDANGTVVKNRGQVQGFRQIIGEIISVDDKSITVKLTDGGSKIILIPDSTIINQSVTASKTDLKVGIKIAINGDINTDGSVTGKSININTQNDSPIDTVTK